jgi:hypothetical protein
LERPRLGSKRKNREGLGGKQKKLAVANIFFKIPPVAARYRQVQGRPGGVGNGPNQTIPDWIFRRPSNGSPDECGTDPMVSPPV